MYLNTLYKSWDAKTVLDLYNKIIEPSLHLQSKIFIYFKFHSLSWNFLNLDKNAIMKKLWILNKVFWYFRFIFSCNSFCRFSCTSKKSSICKIELYYQIYFTLFKTRIIHINPYCFYSFKETKHCKFLKTYLCGLIYYSRFVYEC